MTTTNETENSEMRPVVTELARTLSPAAERALAEAAERRRLAQPDRPPEHNGRGGLEPVRYGDWEVKGLAYDF